MEKVYLGSTGIEVSRLCFGSLTMTPFQANLTIQDGAELIIDAYNSGINFIDTAEIYENYAYIKEALKVIGRENMVISTKTYAYTKELAHESLTKALKELDTDYIDIFLLHEQESIYTLQGHQEAIDYFMEAKKQGLIKAFGLSTHRIEGVLAAKEHKSIEVIHPIVNKNGIGIQDGNIEQMLKAIEEVRELGVGIYSMKPLGGGHLISDYSKSFEYVKNLKCIDSIAIGMQSIDELKANVNFINGTSLSDELKSSLRKKNRRLIVADYCVGCGNCEARCQQNGIKVIDSIAVPNDNCILCGYCATVCPEFCIKVI